VVVTDTLPLPPDNAELLPLDTTLWPEGAKLLVAVSGGADSIALLGAMQAHHLDIVAAHVNHGLRGEQSDGDEEFVLRHCHAIDVPVTTRRVQVPLRNGWAHEAAARQARYTALLSMCREAGCSVIATGHTADDSLETILLNLLRAASVEGLAGIPRSRRLAADITLVRPIWRTTRAQTHAACRANAWPWREDDSNTDLRYRRNRLRAEVLPVLAAISPDGAAGLARRAAQSSSVLRDEFDFVAKTAADALREIYISEEADKLTIDGLAFRRLHPALQRRLLRQAARRLAGESYCVAYELVEIVRVHIAGDLRRAVWCWPGQLRIEWTGAMAGNRIRLWRVGESQVIAGSLI
jgi:tRNA(Ile)-lysidine synthase